MRNSVSHVGFGFFLYNHVSLRSAKNSHSRFKKKIIIAKRKIEENRPRGQLVLQKWNLIDVLEAQ